MFAQLQLDDDFAKVLPLPLINLVVRPIDTMIRALPQWFGWLLRPAMNTMHIIAFLITAAWALAQEKPITFKSHDQWMNNTSIIQTQSDGSIQCSANPSFCVPFGFGYEAMAWSKLIGERQP
jgi:hypothetical protein